jgi:asparagine N-glycosylation enzyme membrane subunit Stt3
MMIIWNGLLSGIGFFLGFFVVQFIIDDLPKIKRKYWK